MKLKKDKRNYRIHDEKSKRIIGQSLDQCGAGRSILADSTGEVIAGNGVLEQAEKRGIKIKTVETDGSELVVVVRKDLKPGDEKRKLLALADNAASDASSWNAELVRADWGKEKGQEWGISENVWEANPTEFAAPQTPSVPSAEVEFDESSLPPELQGVEITPNTLPKVDGEFKTERGRIIISYPWERGEELCRMLGLENLNKIVYTLEEIVGEE